jgi:hypothetical protein
VRKRSESATNTAQPPFEPIPLNSRAEFPAHGINSTRRLPTWPNPQTPPPDPIHIAGKKIREESDGEPFTALAAAAVKNCATTRGAHAFAKTVFVPPFSIAGLKSAFHKE